LPFVLLRSATSTFLARGDTLTPMKALFVSVAVNVALKIALMGDFAQAGLAFATSVGAWVNLGLLVWFAHRAGLMEWDQRLKLSVLKLAIASVALAIALWLALRMLTPVVASLASLRAEMLLGALALIGAVVYFGAVALLFGRQWFAAFRGSRGITASARDVPPPSD
jgi:putative peptidoglycan lipid II flippase